MPEPRSEPFGEMLRRFRIRAGKTLGEVAEIARVKVAYLSDIERTRRAPLTNDKVLEMARFLGLSIDEQLELSMRGAQDRGSFEIRVDAMNPGTLEQHTAFALLRSDAGSLTEADARRIEAFIAGKVRDIPPDKRE